MTIISRIKKDFFWVKLTATVINLDEKRSLLTYYYKQQQKKEAKQNNTKTNMGFWINLILFVSGSIVLYFIKQYFNGGVCTIRKEISSKIVIITGASAGIGLETARYLAAMGGTIIFGCRNENKTIEAI